MTRLIRIAAGAALALWSAAATAGGADAPQPGSPPVQPSPAPAAPAALPSQKQGTPALVLDTDEYEGLLGKSVRAMNGDDLGRIIDVIVDKEGRPRAAIIDFGGFLGVGSRKIAVDWRVLRFATPDGKTGPVTLQLSRNQVRVSPEYKSGEPIVVLGAASPGGTNGGANGDGEPAAAPSANPHPPASPPTAQERQQEKPAEKAPEKTLDKPLDKPPEKAPE